jgi:hypothetical protein
VKETVAVTTAVRVVRPRPVPLVLQLSEEERAAHLGCVAELGGDAVWRDYLSGTELGAVGNRQ